MDLALKGRRKSPSLSAGSQNPGWEASLLTSPEIANLQGLVEPELAE